jgi:peptide-methionine (S)-S-oxide reductase
LRELEPKSSASANFATSAGCCDYSVAGGQALSALQLGMRAYETATLGGGCFWCLEAVFRRLHGIESAEPGYMGGRTAFPAYEDVCDGETGHAEVVQLRFDPEVVAYWEILDVFFSIHDPTTLNRQGADEGTQYRSVIFYHNDEQRMQAEATVRALGEKGVWEEPVVTVIEAAGPFYRAEEHHRGYYETHAAQPYCVAVIGPKLGKFREKFPEKLRKVL